MTRLLGNDISRRFQHSLNLYITKLARNLSKISVDLSSFTAPSLLSPMPRLGHRSQQVRQFFLSRLFKEKWTGAFLENFKTLNPQNYPVLTLFRNLLLHRSRRTADLVRLKLGQSFNLFSGRVSAYLNHITGFNAIEKLRENVMDIDRQYLAQRSLLKEASAKYMSTTELRLSYQKELSALLSRKTEWREVDVHKFSQLMTDELLLEQREKVDKQNLADSNEKLDILHDKLMDALRERYQVEHVWSDKIRFISTVGTIVLMAVNLIIFVAVQVLWEPKKRKLLVSDFQQVITRDFLPVNNEASTRISDDSPDPDLVGPNFISSSPNQSSNFTAKDEAHDSLVPEASPSDSLNLSLHTILDKLAALESQLVLVTPHPASDSSYLHPSLDFKTYSLIAALSGAFVATCITSILRFHVFN